MKKNFLFVLAAMTAIGFSSCSNNDADEVANNNNPSTLDVNVGIQKNLSRAGITATEFTNGESLGVYLYRGDGIASAVEYSDDTDNFTTKNVEYTQASSGWSSTSKIILSAVKGIAYAYYPYDAKNASNNGKSIPVTVNTNQGTGQSDGIKDASEQTDYMWATPVNEVSNVKDKNKVNFTMNHALSKITYKFIQAKDGEDKYPGIGQVTSIVLDNGDTKSNIKTGAASMNIGDGTLAVTGTAGTITLNGITTSTLMDESSASLLPSMLIYPTGPIEKGDVKVTFTVDGSEYTLSIPALTSGYVAGKNYVYTFKMKGTGLEVSSVTITKWEDVAIEDAGDLQEPNA